MYVWSDVMIQKNYYRTSEKITIQNTNQITSQIVTQIASQMFIPSSCIHLFSDEAIDKLSSACIRDDNQLGGSHWICGNKWNT